MREYELGRKTGGSGPSAGNISVMLGMLESIRLEATEDEVMDQFSATVELAIDQLRELQRIAYETMIEIEAERGMGRCNLRLVERKPH